MRPGDRKQRWKQSTGASAAFFILFGVLAAGSIDGWAGVGVAAFMFFMAGLEALDYKRGWKIKNSRPPWADRFEARDPDLKKIRYSYSFEDKPDLSKCPGCGGLADNGHDRCDPPNVYCCTECTTVCEHGKGLTDYCEPCGRINSE